MRPATSRAVATSGTAPSEPGTSGTPSRAIAALAAILSPIMRICVGRGADEGQAVRLHHLGEAGILDRKP